MRSPYPLSALLLLSTSFLPSPTLAAPGPLPSTDVCTATDPQTSEWYDLRPLMRNVGQDYVAKGDNGREYRLNACRGVLGETWRVPDPESVGVYVQDEKSGYSLGRVSTTPYAHDRALFLTYTEGSSCPARPDVKMSSIISFVCDLSVYAEGNPVWLASTSEGCAHYFQWRTKYACPTARTRGVGGALGVVAMVIVIGMIVYFGLAVVYNRVVLKKRGWDQIPALEFVRDMVVIVGFTVYEKVMGCFNRDGRRGGFRGLGEEEDRYASTGLMEDDED